MNLNTVSSAFRTVEGLMLLLSACRAAAAIEPPMTGESLVYSSIKFTVACDVLNILTEKGKYCFHGFLVSPVIFRRESNYEV